MPSHQPPQSTKRAKAREGLVSDPWSRAVIGAAIRVHRALGPGLLESAYQESLAAALESAGVPFEREFPVPAFFEEKLLATHFRLDFLVGGCLVVELKATESMQPVHAAQLLSYLRLGGYQLGLLLNFGLPTLRAGIRRFINSY
ncbi:MAG: GxxExxY protein [Gemmatimonadaceae bacterium]